jgi:hypothetical protein
VIDHRFFRRKGEWRGGVNCGKPSLKGLDAVVGTMIGWNVTEGEGLGTFEFKFASFINLEAQPESPF